MRGRLSQAREGQERGKGEPLFDIDRACRHYGITPEQYWLCPSCYPLPERGTGLSSGFDEVPWATVLAISVASLVVGLILSKIPRS